MDACREGRQGTRVLSAADLKFRSWVAVSSIPPSSSGVLCDTSPEPADALWLGEERTQGGGTTPLRDGLSTRGPRSSRRV